MRYAQPQETRLVPAHRAAAAAGAVNGIAACIRILGTADPALAHLLIMTDVSIWELPPGLEQYCNGQSCHRQADKNS